MKEIERIALLKELRRQREEAAKVVEGFSEESKELFNRASENTNNPKDNVGLLDYIIYSSYQCAHEYAVKNSSEDYCLCLDCEECLSEKAATTTYYVDDVNVETVRKRYLELLQEMSVCDAFTTLKEEYNFKRKKRIYRK